MERQIVTAVRLGGEWSLYRSPPDYWVLDWTRWAADFGGGDDVSNCDARFGIPVVDESSAKEFLAKMKPFEADAVSLGAELENAWTEGDPRWEEVADRFPCLCVDFDQRALSSVNSESPAFEQYVPPGWSGVWDSFYDDLPSELQYWKTAKGDLLQRLAG